MAIQSLKYVPNARTTTTDDVPHGNNILGARANILVGEFLTRNDIAYDKVSDKLWEKFEAKGERLNLETAKDLLLENFPELKGKIRALAGRLCQLQPETFQTDAFEIELVTIRELPTARNTGRRWAIDPFTAFMDLSPKVKGVIAENLSETSDNGTPYAPAIFQRGKDDWIGAMAELGVDFSGYRPDADQGPLEHEAAVEGLKAKVINFDMEGVLVKAEDPSLYDFGSVMRLTALDHVGDVIGIATVRPKNIDRQILRRGGQQISNTANDGRDTTQPQVNHDRLAVETKLAVPPGMKTEVLAAGALVPREYVRMNAVIGSQTIREPGAAVELQLSNTPVARAMIPFSGANNVPANERVEKPNVHHDVDGTTMQEMAEQQASVCAAGSMARGKLKDGEGAPVEGTVLQYAFRAREGVTTAGQPLTNAPYNNDGLILSAPEGEDLQDHLRPLGLDVVQRKIPGTTDQEFEITVKPEFLKANGPVMIDVGYYQEPGKFVWSNEDNGSSMEKPDQRKFTGKEQTFKIVVPDEVFRRGTHETPSPMQVRIFQPGKTPVYLGAVGFDMKQIDLTFGQLSKPDQLHVRKERATTKFENAYTAAVDSGAVIAETISASELGKRLEAGGSWEFNVNGQEYSIRMDPEAEDQSTANAVIMQGDTVLDRDDNAVRFNKHDDLVPNGHFVVDMKTIIGANQAMYVGDETVRFAPYPLAADVAGEQGSAREARKQALLAKSEEEGCPDLHENKLWAGVEVEGRVLNSREDLAEVVRDLDAQRLDALREMKGDRHCDDDVSQAAQQS